MRKIFNTDKIIISMLWIILTVIFCLTYGKFGSLFADCGREVYIPWQLLKGEVLYHDVFNIYAPGAYLFNALLFKIFLPHLSVLYIAGFVNLCIIVTFSYLIVRQFLALKTSLIMVACMVILANTSVNVFNFVFPYSYGMVYGLSTALISIYFLIRREYVYDDYLAALFAGISACCKYEFLPLIVPLFFFSFAGLKNFKKICLVTTVFFTPIIVMLLPLFTQGLSASDLYKEYYIISEIMQSKTMHFFYQISGIEFCPQHIPLISLSLAGFTVVTLLYLKLKNIPSVLKWSILFSAAFILYRLFEYKLFVFIPISILAIFLLRFNKYSLKTKIVVFSYFAISLKVFFSLMLFSYGTYYIGLSICILCILLPIKLRRSFCAAVLICCILLFLFSIPTTSTKTEKIKTPRGIIFANKYQAVPYIQTYNYLKNNTKPGDIVLFFPEEPLMNFMLERDNDNYLYSLIPMYIEAFEEVYILERIVNTNAEYIVINEWDTSCYGFARFGVDYATQMMKYIEENYNKVFETDYGLQHKIYKRRTI